MGEETGEVASMSSCERVSWPSGRSEVFFAE